MSTIGQLSGFIYLFSGNAVYNTNGVPKIYLVIYQPHTTFTSMLVCQIIRH